jgi:hypothetical protein
MLNSQNVGIIGLKSGTANLIKIKDLKKMMILR